jgi:hypothetical protein
LIAQRVFGPHEHPHDGPVLAAWGGHYDHAFVALHPFISDDDAPDGAPVSWAEIARGLGGPPFGDFAIAVTLAANGMDGSENSDADRSLIARLMTYVRQHNLEYPDDGRFTNALREPVIDILRRIGTEAAIVFDGHGQYERELPLDRLIAQKLCGEWLDYPVSRRYPTGVADAADRFVISGFPMDNYYSIIGITTAALERLGGDLRLEGFWAGPQTTFHWVGEPGTYSYPDWLREAPDAA